MDSQKTPNVLMEAVETGTYPELELRALEVPEWACFVMANSRRGAWEMSRNTNNALPNLFLGGERAQKYTHSLYGVSSTFWKCLVRTRMLDVVRGRKLVTPSTNCNNKMIYNDVSLDDPELIWTTNPNPVQKSITADGLITPQATYVSSALHLRCFPR